ncbi:hypothetical protein Tsubulata_003590 [Turnera subulata]|uniref:Pleiotropic ABC efflux transporter N-terminal domain-containing protein n=1 Tax=Turnera subulata TaxID=218843 RepID=A0A9Q0JAU2_9ROSI|nr:hypothetical protein Tsubulata_003590 [Turnera subulata]
MYSTVRLLANHNHTDMAAASNGSEYFELDIDPVRDSFARQSNAEALEDEDELVWEAISRLPSQKRGTTAILRRSPSEYAARGGEGQRAEAIDVTKLDRANRELLVKKALATNEQDNSRLLAAIKERLDRVGIEVPKVEVRFKNLSVEAKVQGVLRTLRVFRAKRFPLTILHDVSGIVRPGRSTSQTNYFDLIRILSNTEKKPLFVFEENYDDLAPRTTGFW